jgi:hypothetical protein
MARINFIGVIGKYIPYKEKAVSDQTGDVRVVFQENTGLSMVWSVHFINEIINSKAYLDQLNKVLIREKRLMEE